MYTKLIALFCGCSISIISLASVVVVNDLSRPWWDCAEAPYSSEINAYRSPALRDGDETSLSFKIRGMKNVVFYWKGVESSDAFLRVNVDGEEVDLLPASLSSWEPMPLSFSDSSSHEVTFTLIAGSGVEDSVIWIWSEMFGYGMSRWDGDYDATYTTFSSECAADETTTSFSITCCGNDGQGSLVIGWMENSATTDRVKLFVDEAEYEFNTNDEDWHSEGLDFDDTALHIIKVVFCHDYSFNWSADTPHSMHVFYDSYWMPVQVIDYSESHMTSPVFSLDLDDFGRDTVSRILGDDGGVLYETQQDAPWICNANNGVEGASMQSGSAEGSSWMSATVVGAGTFSFQWQVKGGDWAYCYVDDVYYSAAVSMDTWRTESISLSEDKAHVIKWVYEKSGGMNGACIVDDIQWIAPGGWLDPEDRTVEVSRIATCSLDLVGSPRTLVVSQNMPYQALQTIVFSPDWASAAKVRIKLDDTIIAETSDSGTFEWNPKVPGEYKFTLAQLDDGGEVLGEEQTAVFIVTKADEKGVVIIIK